jgi:hypothetical protein
LVHNKGKLLSFEFMRRISRLLENKLISDDWAKNEKE